MQHRKTTKFIVPGKAKKRNDGKYEAKKREPLKPITAALPELNFDKLTEEEKYL